MIRSRLQTVMQPRTGTALSVRGVLPRGKAGAAGSIFQRMRTISEPRTAAAPQRSTTAPLPSGGVTADRAAEALLTAEPSALEVEAQEDVVAKEETAALMADGVPENSTAEKPKGNALGIAAGAGAGFLFAGPIGAVIGAAAGALLGKKKGA